MIVREVMTTRLITVVPGDTLSHAANLMRQHQFHHLPVVRVANATERGKAGPGMSNAPLLLEGMLTSNDINLAVELDKQNSSDKELARTWQERHVVEVMQRAPIGVTPTTSVANAAQIMIERDLNCLPIVAYESAEVSSEEAEQEMFPILVGILTRSDMLLALAHLTGTFEPGMQLLLPLPPGDVTPLAKMLLLAAELHIQVSSIVVASLKENVPHVATVHISTIYPAPLLKRLQENGIQYSFAERGDTHVAHE